MRWGESALLIITPNIEQKMMAASISFRVYNSTVRVERARYWRSQIALRAINEGVQDSIIGLSMRVYKTLLYPAYERVFGVYMMLVY